MKGGSKKWFLLLSLLLCSFPVFAAFESLSLHVGESREIKGVNFTLLKTNNDDKVIMCVNNQKVIVSDDLSVGISIIKLRDVFSKAANLEIDVACKDDCECTDECSNEDCSLSNALCSVDKDCGDSNNNTVDSCVSGVCKNNPVQLAPCISDSDCDDKNPCTTDRCNKVLKKCIHIEVENCSIEPEQPSQEDQEGKSLPFAELSAYLLTGLVVLLLVALLIKKLVS